MRVCSHILPHMYSTSMCARRRGENDDALGQRLLLLRFALGAGGQISRETRIDKEDKDLSFFLLFFGSRYPPSYERRFVVRRDVSERTALIDN